MPAHEGRRTAICAHEAPSRLKLGLIDELLQAEALRSAAGGRPAQIALLPASGQRQSAAERQPFTFNLSLESYETVRAAAGQLVAERMVEEAVRLLESTLRPFDTIDRVGSDTLSLTVWLNEEEPLESLRKRITDAVSSVSLPRRVPPIRPRLRAVSESEQAVV